MKFRAWDKVAEDMLIPEALELDKYGKVTGIFSKGTIFSIEDFELLQSTGLRDKNGKEIFVGDILEYEMIMGFGWYENGRDVVIYDENELKIKMNKRDDYSLNRVVAVGCEVIGNKFEHPHLLEEE